MLNAICSFHSLGSEKRAGNDLNSPTTRARMNKLKIRLQPWFPGEIFHKGIWWISMEIHGVKDSRELVKPKTCSRYVLMVKTLFVSYNLLLQQHRVTLIAHAHVVPTNTGIFFCAV